MIPCLDSIVSAWNIVVARLVVKRDFSFQRFCIHTQPIIV